VCEMYSHNVTSLVKPGGLYVTAALRNTTSYEVGDRTFPSANVNEKDIKRFLFRKREDGKLDFSPENTNIEHRGLKGHGYSGIVLGRAVKNL
jgi:hypothetical protein